MSIEVTRQAIEESYAAASIEQIRDASLVVGAMNEAEQSGRPTDGAFVDELAEERQEKAMSEYVYPVYRTGPTLSSSLRIVKDIVTIRRLEATKDERTADIKALGGDIKLMNATGLEQQHRLWEKGIMRVLDPRTNTSMWSFEFDELVASRKYIATT